MEAMKQRSGSLAGHVGALLALLAALLGVPSPARAHPIPRDNHDRTLIVRLTPEALLVSYRLELDDGQALRDFPPEELPRLTGRNEFFPLFTRYYGPVLA